MLLGMEHLDVALIIATAVKWLIYTALLWIMLKVQKLNYNVLGLFGSSLAATLTHFIPFVGPYLSYVVLVICLWKCTGADIAPDVVFTVGIAGALMFCVNLWIIGMLIGRLRPDLAHDQKDGPPSTEMVEEDSDGEETPDQAKPSEAKPAAAHAISPTNGMPVAARSPASKPKPNPGPAAPVVSTGPFSIKGVSRGGGRTSVIISDGGHVYTVGRGESFTATLPQQGRVRIRCDDITDSLVVLKNGDGQTIELRLP